LPVRVLGNLDGAGAVLTLKNHYRRRPDSLRQAESRGLPIHILKSNSVTQVRDALSRIYGVDKHDEATTRALAEAAAAIKTVKTTQVELLAQAIASREPVMVREPGGNELGERIREIVLYGAMELDAEAEMYLFMAARKQLISEVIAPALAAGQIVVADRYHDS